MDPFPMPSLGKCQREVLTQTHSAPILEEKVCFSHHFTQRSKHHEIGRTWEVFLITFNRALTSESQKHTSFDISKSNQGSTNELMIFFTDERTLST